MQFETLDTWSSIFSNVATGLTAIVIAIVTCMGWNEWKRQQRCEAVRRLLLLARKFRAAFDGSRGPVTWSSEYADRPRSEDETPTEAQILDKRYARLNRLRPAADILPELAQAAWEVEIVTGEELVPVVCTFREVVWEVNLAIIGYFDERLDSGSTQTEEGREAYLLIYRSEDELNERVHDALEELEKKLKKYVR